MNQWLRDLAYGFRQIIRRPLFSGAAIASLALGIGLNTTLFSVINGVLFKGGPIAKRDRLVEIYTGINQDFPHLTTSYPDYLDLRQADALRAIAANSYVRGILSGAGRSVLVTGETVTANFFEVLGISPILGRSFRDDEDDAPGIASVVVLSHSLWQQRYGARADVLGAPIRLSGATYTVIGVAPAGFTGTIPGIPTEFWVPVTMVEQFAFSGVQVSADNDPGKTRLDRRGSRWLHLKGRLADGRTVDEAEAQVRAIFARLSSDYPVTNDKVTGSVLPASSIRFHPMLDGYIRAAGAGLLGAVGLVLLIACANVANLLLARGAARRREIAIRAAIGASRGRIVRQLLSESLALATVGGALGVLIAAGATRAVSGLGSNVFPIPVAFDFSIDGTVLAFAVAASMATAVAFGLLPALSISKLELVPMLKGFDERIVRRRMSLADLLVVGQLAVSLVLLVTGALLVRGLLTARNTDIGFDPSHISSLSFNLQMNGYDDDRAAALEQNALAALRSLPGVVAVSTASRLPLAPDINMDGILIPGRHVEGEDGALTDVVSVGADYFAAVGVPIVAGRAFSEADVAQGRRIAIVNETMARVFWPSESAIGKRMYVGDFKSEPTEIVGIARDHKVRSVGEAPRPYVHFPAGRSRSIGLVVRTAAPAEAALPALREALWKLEPDILFTEDVSAVDVAATTLGPTRLGAMAIGAFGGLALLLAAVGLYGVIAYSVSRRTREVGIRIALGAERGRVLRMVLRQGSRLTLIGILVGGVAAAGAARLIDSLIYGVSTVDPLAYGAAVGLLILVTFAANLLPALTAARVDPVRALGTE